jgi:hypothetical protein
MQQPAYRIPEDLKSFVSARAAAMEARPPGNRHEAAGKARYLLDLFADMLVRKHPRSWKLFAAGPADSSGFYGEQVIGRVRPMQIGPEQFSMIQGG